MKKFAQIRKSGGPVTFYNANLNLQTRSQVEKFADNKLMTKTNSNAILTKKMETIFNVHCFWLQKKL